MRLNVAGGHGGAAFVCGGGGGAEGLGLTEGHCTHYWNHIKILKVKTPTKVAAITESQSLRTTYTPMNSLPGLCRHLKHVNKQLADTFTPDLHCCDLSETCYLPFTLALFDKVY